METPIYFLWTEAMSVGIPVIDHQHRRLFNMIGRLASAVGAGEPDEVMIDILDELGHYAITHFGTEERYFADYEYPDAEAHLTEHQAFIDEIERVRLDFEMGSWESSLKLLSYLGNWFTDHIMSTDMQYAAL